MSPKRLFVGRPVAVAAALCLLAAALPGCGAKTCKRIARDREAFLSRTAEGAGAHLEVTIPYSTANALIEPELAKIPPVGVDVPELGALASAFGELRIAPRRARLQKATGNLVGLRLDFDVLAGGDDAFGVWIETAFSPVVDLSGGAVSLGFSKESLEKVTPHVTDDAAKKLGGIVYGNIPGIARALVPRSAVDKAAGVAVEFLISRFYELSRDALLAKVSELARIRVALPDVPVRDLSLEPTAAAGGGLRLSIATGLPVAKGLGARAREEPLPEGGISVRAPAAALAELANWAMGRGLAPSRYNGKGKADEKGEFVAALEWVPGKRPLKVHLWQLEGSCKRIDMGAEAAVEVEGGALRIRATGGVIEGSEAAPFTELGVFFYALGKDPVKTTITRPAELEFSAGGQKLVSRIEKAELAGDEVTMTVALERQKR